MERSNTGLRHVPRLVTKIWDQAYVRVHRIQNFCPNCIERIREASVQKQHSDGSAAFLSLWHACERRSRSGGSLPETKPARSEWQRAKARWSSRESGRSTQMATSQHWQPLGLRLLQHKSSGGSRLVSKFARQRYKAESSGQSFLPGNRTKRGVLFPCACIQCELIESSPSEALQARNRKRPLQNPHAKQSLYRRCLGTERFYACYTKPILPIRQPEKALQRCR